MKVRSPGLSSSLDLSTLSEGQQQLLILLSAIKIRKSRNVYFIEEPEVHIHSGSQKKLLQLLLAECKDSQFFITTHSPSFVIVDQGVNNYLVMKNKGQTDTTPLENEKLWFIKKQMGIDNSDSWQSNIVLFVEGPSEKAALEKLGEFPQYSVLKPNINSINIITYEGDSHFETLTQFMRYVRELGRVPIIIYDGHQKIIQKVVELERGKVLHKKPRKMNEELEDQFDNEILVKAMKRLYNEGSCQFTMSREELKNNREKKNVATILNEFLKGACGEKLDKTKLAEILGDIIVFEIKNGVPRKKQQFEIEADTIMNIINSRS